MSPLMKLKQSSPFELLCAALLLSLCAGSASAAGASGARAESASCAVPAFPARWQEDGDTGIVTLAVLVGADGKVMASKLLHSSGITRVDRASLKASSQCTFQPGARDQSMPAWTKVRYNWVVE